MTVETELDKIQARLHDDGAIWDRDELLRTYNDGYRIFLALSGAVRRWRPTDLPGRHGFGITQEWEDGLAAGATVRKPTRSAMAEAWQAMSLWEVEALEGLTPSDSLDGHTQEWERAYLTDSDLHFRFSFPKNHERIVRMEWQNRRLWPTSVRELDETDTRWFKQIGEPRWWTTGTGRVRSVELYEVSSAYNQAYAVEGNPLGLARTFAGERDYAVDVPIPPGTAYAYTSPADVPTTLNGLGWRFTTPTTNPYDPYPTTVLADSPYGYWRFSEDTGLLSFEVSAGGGKTGAYQGGVSHGVLGLLKLDPDGAATFDGSDDVVDLNDATFTATSITVEAWIRATTLPTGISDATALFSKSNQTDDGFQLRLESGGRIRWFSPHTTSSVSLLSGSHIGRGGVYHVAATWDGTTARIYVNGEQVTSTTNSGSWVTTTARKLYVGARNGATTDLVFIGTIDEPAIYKSALSATRILAHYLAGSWTPTHCVHAWEVDFLNGETTLTESETIGTYTWEEQFGSAELRLAVGTVRSVSSPDRQYLPVTSDATEGSLYGRVMEWRSSEDSVMVLEVVIPDGDLAEADTPSLIPPQMGKYLRHYVLSWAFARPGEGRQAILADHYARRFKGGVDVFRGMSDVARADRVYQRQEVVPVERRVARVQLPSSYPRVW